MASKLSFSLLFFLLTAIAAVVSARPGLPFHPCNTLVISSYSFSLPQNPNTHLFFLDFRPINRLPLRHRHIFLHPLPAAEIAQPRLPQRPDTRMTDLPLGFSSFRDRTKDILSVVASLLFGAACGALTAGTMYLIWALFNYRPDSYHGFASDDDEDGDEDDVFNPKKSHYVAIPGSPVMEKNANGFATAEAKKDGDAADVHAAVKETV